MFLNCYGRRRRGQIALLGSLAAWRGLPTSPEYSASKAGLRALVEGLRARVRADGLAIALVEPGFVATPMSDRLRTPKPFLISADRAAAIIARRLAAGAREIAFPLPLVLLERLLLALPRGRTASRRGGEPRKGRTLERPAAAREAGRALPRRLTCGARRGSNATRRKIRCAPGRTMRMARSKRLTTIRPAAKQGGATP